MLSAQVEVEEKVYDFQPPQNGSGPMWCRGSSCICRVDGEVFTSGLETLLEAKPLHDCVPLLFQRTESRWRRLFRHERRTRKPSPLCCNPDGRLFALYHLSCVGNLVREVAPDFGEAVAVPLRAPLPQFFTATVRGGSPPSDIVDLLGVAGTTIRYARLRLA